MNHNNNELSANNRLAMNLQILMQNKNMHEAELARKTLIPQPTLHKIIAGTTADPRASTLRILADYFNITIDALYSQNIENNKLNAKNEFHAQTLPILSWTECISLQKFKNIDTKNSIISEFISKNAYALISKPSMEPKFLTGTTLIIDPDAVPVDGDLVVIHFKDTTEATLREITIDGPLKTVQTVGRNSVPMGFKESNRVLGVVVKTIWKVR